MARIFKALMRDALVTENLVELEGRERLPSPEELQGKIILKGSFKGNVRIGSFVISPEMGSLVHVCRFVISPKMGSLVRIGSFVISPEMGSLVHNFLSPSQKGTAPRTTKEVSVSAPLVVHCHY